jgi:hypothetical protein
MTPMGLAAGEILTQVDWSGALTQRHLIQSVGWPRHLIVSALGALVREGLVRTTQQGAELLVESIDAWSGAAHLRCHD